MSGTSGIRPDAALEILCALTATAELRAGSSATKDILAETVTRAYTKAGRCVRYLDDCRTHHVSGGEVRCGAHTIHAAGTRWWNSPHQHRTDHT
ncbi:protein-arginine deiminase family protein [Streptomyces torulosus]|uniref:protein-arginine deiminase family protein n=1 Tax=Streptomyces torulosus TaxID=68276 RepID=UPI0006EB51E6|nr:protein-arginine deiminase family protein [Streptomyces torulosus]